MTEQFAPPATPSGPDQTPPRPGKTLIERAEGLYGGRQNGLFSAPPVPAELLRAPVIEPAAEPVAEPRIEAAPAVVAPPAPAPEVHLPPVAVAQDAPAPEYAAIPADQPAPARRWQPTRFHAVDRERLGEAGALPGA
ncbi:MAG TPA: hypothetical protein VFF94_10430, partial [Novosphingobium sp.]|nr:hypothetical protein [Novosphingobium sp.]